MHNSPRSYAQLGEIVCTTRRDHPEIVCATPRDHREIIARSSRDHREIIARSRRDQAHDDFAEIIRPIRPSRARCAAIHVHFVKIARAIRRWPREGLLAECACGACVNESESQRPSRFVSRCLAASTICSAKSTQLARHRSVTEASRKRHGSVLAAPTICSARSA